MDSGFAASRRPGMTISKAHPPLLRFRERLLELPRGLRVLLGDAFPAGRIGLVVILLAGRSFELDGLDARVRLALGVLGILRGEFAGAERFAFRTSLAEHLLLGVVELVPGGLVDEDRNLRRVE